MTIQEFYDLIDENFNDFHSRLPDVSSMTRFVRQFAKDDSYMQLVYALNHADYETAYMYALALKGICLNLNFLHLSDSLTDLTLLMRTDRMNTEACGLCMHDIAVQYANIIDGIQLIDL
ncbi:MAG: hypothetical protein ACI32N_04680 [Bulleidia sp.]